jgi:hypothetical protein
MAMAHGLHVCSLYSIDVLVQCVRWQPRPDPHIWWSAGRRDDRSTRTHPRRGGKDLQRHGTILMATTLSPFMGFWACPQLQPVGLDGTGSGNSYSNSAEMV